MDKSDPPAGLFSLSQLGPFPEEVPGDYPDPPQDAWPELPVTKFHIGIDESGDGGAGSPHAIKEPFLVFAGAYVESARLIELKSRLRSATKSALAEHVGARGDLLELHTGPLLGGLGRYRHVPVKTRGEYLRSVLAISEEFDVRFIVNGIHKPGVASLLERGDTVFERAFRRLVTSIARHAERRSTQLPLTTFTMLADQRPTDEVRSLNLYMSHMYDFDVPIRGEEDLTLRYLCREIEFVDSRSSVLVQLADLAAYISKRRMSRNLGLHRGRKHIDEIALGIEDRMSAMCVSDSVWFPWDYVSMPTTSVSRSCLPATTAFHARRD